eukprot:scaffold64724_cov55-Cyclotella_meneghiniana.AAC.1
MAGYGFITSARLAAAAGCSSSKAVVAASAERLGNSTWNNEPSLCPKELVLQNEIPKFCKTRMTTGKMRLKAASAPVKNGPRPFTPISASRRGGH